jgi:hypothetical protein
MNINDEVYVEYNKRVQKALVKKEVGSAIIVDLLDNNRTVEVPKSDVYARCEEKVQSTAWQRYYSIDSDAVNADDVHSNTLGISSLHLGMLTALVCEDGLELVEVIQLPNTENEFPIVSPITRGKRKSNSITLEGVFRLADDKYTNPIDIGKEIIKYVEPRGISSDSLVPISDVDTLCSDDFIIGVERYGHYYRVVGVWCSDLPSKQTILNSSTLVVQGRADDEYDGARGTTVTVTHVVHNRKCIY